MMSWLMDRPSPVPSPAGGLGCKKGIEDLFRHFGRHTSAVVAKPNFYAVAEILGRGREALGEPAHVADGSNKAKALIVALAAASVG
jgi:hypothetical protein